jgi:hypothetical protein
MIQVGRYIYEQPPTGDWLKIGKVIYGIDSDWIQWYA